METILESEQAALSAGYRKHPNNIYHIPGTEWNAGTAYLPEFPLNAHVYIQDTSTPEYKTHIDSIVPEMNKDIPQNSYPIGVYINVYGNGCTLSLFRRYESFKTFLQEAISIGVKSKPGIPAFMYGD